jgi:hypothetical protein
MYYIPGAAARLYRMTAPGSTWPTPLFGHGAYFTFPPHMLLNPALNPRRGLQLAGQSADRDYFGTQELADEIRAFIPPAGSPKPRPEGIRAPSVRTAAVSGYQPSMLALFFFDPKLGWVPYENRASLIAQWDLVLEFLMLEGRSDAPGLSTTACPFAPLEILEVVDQRQC